MDRYRVPAHFYDVSLIYIDTAGNRGALLKLNGTSFGGCEIFNTGQIVLSSFISANPRHRSERLSYFADYYSLALHYPRISYFAIRNYFQIIRSLLSSIASINNWAITRTRTSGRSIENRLRLSIRDSRVLIRIRIILVLKILAIFRSNQKLNYRDLSAMFLSAQFLGNI